MTRFLSKDAMIYGSIAKGYRGGGFNAASVPAEFSTYDGDTVWTYELGGKASSADGRWLVSSAVYYNDYKDFIGQNALAIGPGGGLVSIDLNLGDVESYGLETEAVASINDFWKLSGSVTLMHARITDQSGWISGHRPAARDRSAAVPAGLEREPQLRRDVPGRHGRCFLEHRHRRQGSRPGSSFDPTTPSILESYTTVNTSVSYRRGDFTATLFANNLFDEEYFESFIDGSLLQALGLLNQDLGMLGTPPRRIPGAVRVLRKWAWGRRGRTPGSEVLRKAAWRLIPLLGVLYFFAFLDRVNVGFAALTMNVDLGLSSAVFGLGAGIFFVGYVAFEIPSNVLLERFGARIWIARIMLSWGVLSASMAFVQGPTSFYVVRFLLGVAEAGFFRASSTT